MRSIALAVSLLASLIACGGPPPAAAETTPARTAASVARAAAPSREGQRSLAEGTGCALSPVYFEYDSNTIDARGRESLVQDARCLRGRPSDAVMLTGGADERGTEEYNFALGDRRARAVQGYLVGVGVEAERLRVRSVGEEWASGRDEAGMAHDRRVEPATPASAR
ncbi:OmpA family protein [Sandaracinus amylolyticus]|uniref:OmpA family protein n=1 Tax=Sandaracinus amylolyticus TaxID=927083 RepID=UPI001F369C68|nr:OmpA family protein [Sandaracinus amylolyticus]UJR85271.1 Hypothetical protein I5071_73510 [Sandaracinus amylolyticus]